MAKNRSRDERTNREGVKQYFLRLAMDRVQQKDLVGFSRTAKGQLNQRIRQGVNQLSNEAIEERDFDEAEAKLYDMLDEMIDIAQEREKNKIELPIYREGYDRKFCRIWPWC